jgi:hypothetical protein
MDSATALLHLAFLVAMLLIVVGGLLALLILWYVRGRDPRAGPVAAYLAEPPDDLPPGAAGTLLDEHADEQDVLATLLGLARHGAVDIVEVTEEGVRDYSLVLTHPERIENQIERDLLVVLFGHNPHVPSEVRLGAVRERFLAHRQRIRADLYREMVDRGYFSRSPEETRSRWRRLAWGGGVASVAIGGGLTLLTDAWALLPAIAGVIVSLALLRVARQMPQKTRHGAEAAAKWRAFRTYLGDIRRYESLETATDLFDRILAYAVAFGIESQWVRSFERAGAPVPRWYHSAGEGFVLGETGEALAQVGHLGQAAGGMENLGEVSLASVDLAGVGDGLQGASEFMSSGLQGASDGILGLFDAAGSIFDGLDFDF